MLQTCAVLECKGLFVCLERIHSGDSKARTKESLLKKERIGLSDSKACTEESLLKKEHINRSIHQFKES